MHLALLASTVVADRFQIIIIHRSLAGVVAVWLGEADRGAIVIDYAELYHCSEYAELNSRGPRARYAEKVCACVASLGVVWSRRQHGVTKRPVRREDFVPKRWRRARLHSSQDQFAHSCCTIKIEKIQMEWHLSATVPLDLFFKLPHFLIIL